MGTLIGTKWNRLVIYDRGIDKVSRSIQDSRLFALMIPGLHERKPGTVGNVVPLETNGIEESWKFSEDLVQLGTLTGTK